ncbi:MAG TPA: hypothetical protein VFG10_19280 [Saprospiraceae bacterium]|nr:hypothetical protein [Saprospiraceae bacterium]
MKKHILFIPTFILILLCSYLPATGAHLDGLWRNDRLRITLRIEQDQDGFKAKRTDEGIWYHYTTQDNRYFIDRYGNWYDLIDNEELVWNEAKTNKRIKFLRVDSRDYNSWDHIDNDYGSRYHDDWNNNHHNDLNDHLEGTWFQRNGRDNIQIVPFKGGIRIKADHNGWDKYYGDRSGFRFRSNNGNTVVLIDEDHLRFRSQYGKWEEIYTRHRSWNRDRNNWRD